ncbi:hypothetical protein ACFJGW_00645 [Burkholderiaceae bacterium UC74_6]
MTTPIFKGMEPAWSESEVKGKSSVWKWLIGVPVVGFVLFMVVGLSAHDPEREAKRKAYETCMRDLHDELRPGGTTEFVKSACLRLREEYVQKYGQQP